MPIGLTFAIGRWGHCSTYASGRTIVPTAMARRAAPADAIDPASRPVDRLAQPTAAAPVLPTQPDRIVLELAMLVVTNSAVDADVPANTLTYQLVDPPAGAKLTPPLVL